MEWSLARDRTSQRPKELPHWLLRSGKHFSALRLEPYHLGRVLDLRKRFLFYLKLSIFKGTCYENIMKGEYFLGPQEQEFDTVA